MTTFTIRFNGLEGCTEGQSWTVKSDTKDEVIEIIPDGGEWMGQLFLGDGHYAHEKLWRDNFYDLVRDLLAYADITTYSLREVV